ncbi:MAG: glycosyltransferase [Lachnospiraceae bacterium]|nr:glycosyltransferase [Lachnospiraceae bacterium]
MGNGIFRINNLIKTIRYVKKNGIRHAYYAARERIEEERRDDYYYREPSEETLESQRRESADYPYLFSIVVPAYETKEHFFRKMIDSVCRQSYGNWELIIADAGSSDTVERIVGEVREEFGDKRIIYERLAENKGISGNTNAGIALASGDYIALLDHDDFLAPDALYHMAAELHKAGQQGINPALLYTDEDKYDDNRCFYMAPHRKKKFNFDLILSNNYVCHFMAIEANLLKKLELRGGFDGAQDYDLVLRVIGELYQTNSVCELSQRVIHIPKILYHWCCHIDSTADNTASKSYAYDAGKAALQEFCARQGWRAEVKHGLHLGFYDITYLPDVLEVRDDVGIVGGRLLDSRGRICGGAMEFDGSCMYEGLHKEYSGGSMHRAVLKQDVAAVDIRCMQVRPELRSEFEHIIGLPYRERTIHCKVDGVSREIRIVDTSGFSCDEAGYRKLSMELGRAAAERGYCVLWDPAISIAADA